MEPQRDIRKVLAFGTLLVLVLVVFIGLPMNAGAEPTTIYVDDVPGSGPGNPAEDYTSIQAAINAASAGDTIYIYSGTYYEQVLVTKFVNLEGEDKETTIIQGTGTGYSTRGIYSYSTSGVNVKNLKVQGFYYGITITSSYSPITVTNNIVTDNSYGLYMYYCPSCTVTGNTLTNNAYYGLYVMNSMYATITDNNVVDNGIQGLTLTGSDYCTATGNTATGNGYGLYLANSASCTLRNNVMVDNNYNFGVNSNNLPDYTHDIDSSNKVNGKAIYYLQGVSDVELNSENAYKDAGYIGVINSDKVTIKDFSFSNNYQGILLAETTNSVIHNVEISNVYHGIYLPKSGSCTLTNNTVSNGFLGICLSYSDYCTVTGNTASGFSYGIQLSHSEYCTVTDNTATENTQGVVLMWSAYGTLTGNTALDNTYHGIHVNVSPNTIITGNTAKSNLNSGIMVMDRAHYTTVTGNTLMDNRFGISVSYTNYVTVTDNIVTGSFGTGISMNGADSSTVSGNTVTDNHEGIIIGSSPSNTLRNNTLADNYYNFGVTGYSIIYYYQDIDTSNTINGRSIYYLKDLSGVEFSPESAYNNAGYIGILDSDHITVKDLTLSNNIHGILLVNTPYTTIQNVVVADNKDGIYMSNCPYSTVSGNTVTDTSLNGIYMTYCDYSTVTDNTVSDNGNGLIISGNYNTVTGNTATGNTNYGFQLSGSSCTVTMNTIMDNGNYGIYFSALSSSIITGNTITDNKNGMYLYYSSDNTITCNQIENNMYGIYAFYFTSDNNIYHNNLVDNTYQLYCFYYYVANTWDNGYPSGGNYLNTYTGSDTNNDGIGDTPYVINTDNIDNYPLMTPWGPDDSVDELIVDIEAMELHIGTEESLLDKLGEVLTSIAEEEYTAASNQLEAFKNSVEAQRGKKITEAQADQLIEAAEIIIYMLSAWM